MTGNHHDRQSRFADLFVCVSLKAWCVAPLLLRSIDNWHIFTGLQVSNKLLPITMPHQPFAT